MEGGAGELMPSPPVYRGMPVSPKSRIHAAPSCNRPLHSIPRTDGLFEALPDPLVMRPTPGLVRGCQDRMDSQRVWRNLIPQAALPWCGLKGEGRRAQI